MTHQFVDNPGLADDVVDVARQMFQKVKAKGKLKHVSLQACKSHLGLDKAVIRLLDQLVEDIGGFSKSIVFRVLPDGTAQWDVSPAMYAFNGRHAPGIGVQYPGVYGSTNPKDVLMIGAPWAAIRKGCPDTGHCVYSIITSSMTGVDLLFGDVKKAPDEQMLVPQVDASPLDLARDKKMVYIGKTSVGVFHRFTQHMNSMSKGCMTKFYQVMRGLRGYQPQLPLGVFLIEQHASEDLAYAAEEMLIEKEATTQDFLLLNTVGSRQAFADLKKVESKTTESPEYAEERLAFLSQSAAANWEDPEYARSVICNNPNNLDYIDVCTVRMLHRFGKTPKYISSQLGIKYDQVRRIVTGKAYNRVM